VTDYKCTVHGQYPGGRPWSFGVRVTSNQTLAALSTTWNSAVSAAWTDGTHGLQAIYHTTTSVEFTRVAVLNGLQREVQTQITPLVLAGSSSDTSLPWEVAMLVSLRSAYVGKHNRGRFYLPAIVEGVVVDNVIASSTCTRVRDAVAAMLGAIRADGSTIYVVNLKPLKDGITPAFTKTVITSQLTSNKPARQSRRTKSQTAAYV
jgi:hypothetical protein